MEPNSKYYLGRIFDPKQGKATSQPLLYDPADLTTHAVVVGMTGSGKTGLCIGLLEEAALNHVPALLIDPKGDITNTLLHFPDLLPGDFQPWIDPDQARRAGQTMEQAAGATAVHWKAGLAEWDIPPERVRALKEAAHFAVYTPGSDAGIPVSILASFTAPPIPWESNREVLREKISGTVTALLGLVGVRDIDPVRSREHILLSNIFEHAWSQGQSLDLSALILQTQSPPFPKLGVFDVNTFFPEKDRFDLAMMLNNILAAPAFESWLEGQPLDIPSLLYAPDGRPRHSVFYLAHLTDDERMFFVTLLFTAVETWMRSQGGSPSLRAIVYFDEIFGYLPPVSNPPSKQPMLSMLKQARAFGVGLVLVTQNPVDIDYKGLSNAGTWLIGKLQTDQDKQRLLDGLQGALAGALDRSEYDRLISGLGKRVFLMNNVHQDKPVLYLTRWTMNYLAGPLTRAQIPALNQLAGAIQPEHPAAAGIAGAIGSAGTIGSAGAAPAAAASPAPVASQPLVAAPFAVPPSPPQEAVPPPASSVSRPPSTTGSSTRPSIPAGIHEYFLPNNLTLTEAIKASGQISPGDFQTLGLTYRPVVVAQARIRFLNRSYNLDYELPAAALVEAPDRRGVVRWENYSADTIDLHQLDDQPSPGASFDALEAPLSDVKIMGGMQKDFLDWAYRTSQVTVRNNPALKLYAGPQVTQAEFHQMCAEAARKGRDDELQKITDSFDKRINVIAEKLAREQREMAQDQTRLSQRKTEELGNAAEAVLGIFGGRKSGRRLSTTLTKHRLTSEAKASVEESQEAIADFQKQIAALEKEKAQALEEGNQRWGDAASQVNELKVTPAKKDVSLDLFGVAWFPYYKVEAGGKQSELPGYGK